MPRLKSLQTNFISGELDPLLVGRTDIKQYFQGCQLARNVFLLPQGGAKRRPGLEYIDILAETLNRVTGQTITAPNGGVTANANDNDTATELVTTTGISTTDPYIVAHYDLLTAKTIKFADVLGFRLDVGSSTAEFRVQYSTDDITFVDFGASTMNASTTDNTKRHHSATAVTARYWRFVRIGTTDLTTSIAAIDELNLYEESGTLSESKAVSFVFSTTQTYKLVFTDFNIAIYLGKVLQTHVKSAFASADLASLTWTQSLDTMLLFHEDYQTQVLTRGLDHDLWVTTDAAWVSIPTYRFTPVNTNPAATLTPSATVGTVTCTAGAAVFTSALVDVGQYISGNGGYGRIVEFVSTTVVKVTMLTPFYDVTAIASGDWTHEAGWEEAWSLTQGYPRCGAFYQGRLVIGGSANLPQSVWLSKVNQFFDFDLASGLDDEAIAITLDTDDVAAINAVYSGRTLQIFTSSAEFFVPSQVSNVITPDNISVQRTTRNGSTEGLPVHNVDGETMFINRSGGALKGFVYQDLEQSYISTSKSLLSSHLIRVPVATAFRKSTSTVDADYILLVNGDGTLAILNTLRTQDVNGWSLTEIDGSIKSVAVELDIMFFTTERTLNGVTKRYVEYFDDIHALDSSIRITTGLPTSTFTGLDHLNGETVEVIADGLRLTPVLVTGGSATIERDAVGYVEFGLPYVQTGDDSGQGYKIKTMPIDAQMPDGTIIGKKKRLVEVTAQVQDTQSLKINGNRVGLRKFGSDLLDAPVSPYTGYVVIEGILGYADKVAVDIGDDVPLPATIVSLAYKVAV